MLKIELYDELVLKILFMNKNIRYDFVRKISRLLPIFISQKFRSLFVNYYKEYEEGIDFKVKNITGSDFEGNTSDLHGFKLFFHGWYDWQSIVICQKVIEEYGGNVIEIGSNIGTETIAYSDIAKKWKVYAFEPSLELFSKLKTNLKTKQNCILENKAVSNKNSLMKFAIAPEKYSGQGKILIEGTKERDEFRITEVLAIKLDNYVEEMVGSFTYLHVDTEGHEPFVLEGAYNSIKNNRPIVNLEVIENQLKKFSNKTPSDIFDYFACLEYSVFAVTHFGLVKLDKGKMRESRFLKGNWLAIPKEKTLLEKKISSAIIKALFFKI